MSVNGADDGGSTTPVDLKAPILEVRCGHLVARLHTEKFVCPGIHQPCIELDGELISPKEFTIRANKDKQKDWKGSIRIGKSNMRALMEMKSLDFYNHENYCSAKCQSRNFMSFKNHLTEAYLNADLLYGATSSAFDEDKKTGIMSLYSQVNERSNSVVNAIMSTFMKSQKFDEDLIPAEEDTAGSSNSAVIVMKNQPIRFWAGMDEMGLLSDLTDVMITSMEHLRRLALMGPSQRDAVAERLTRVVGALDLEETIGSRIQAERLNCTVETSLLSNEIQELQKKTEMSWRRLEESRRRASRIDDLFYEDSSPSVTVKRRRHSAAPPPPSVCVTASPITSTPTSVTATATAAPIIDENNGSSVVEQ
ncbi:SAND domain-containing protein [Loa loa]|uniref:SAND domain-containing protein n=1 Tax=Loa loa TaxID=7209 RepID=A0A1I7VNK1_LOALO|nr:SAND domain-containing protein [Loa loa]EFO27974.2 SAND domain-containing protein [Loa loa]